jgi:hypothetical protein
MALFGIYAAMKTVVVGLTRASPCSTDLTTSGPTQFAQVW